MDDPPETPQNAAPAGAEPELEILRKERDSLASERDRIQEELNRLRRSQAVRKLAEDCGFTDPDYLDYLLERRQADPAGPEAVKVISDLQNRSPKLFRVALHPGAPHPPPGTPQTAHFAGTAGRHEELVRRLENAPDRN